MPFCVGNFEEIPRETHEYDCNTSENRPSNSGEFSCVTHVVAGSRSEFSGPRKVNTYVCTISKWSLRCAGKIVTNIHKLGPFDRSLLLKANKLRFDLSVCEFKFVVSAYGIEICMFFRDDLERRFGCLSGKFKNCDGRINFTIFV